MTSTIFIANKTVGNVDNINVISPIFMYIQNQYSGRPEKVRSPVALVDGFTFNRLTIPIEQTNLVYRYHRHKWFQCKKYRLLILRLPCEKSVEGGIQFCINLEAWHIKERFEQPS